MAPKGVVLKQQLNRANFVCEAPKEDVFKQAP
jgi:hypothetical protein